MNKVKILVIILAIAIVVLIAALIISSNMKPAQMVDNVQVKCETPAETTPCTPEPTTEPTPDPTTEPTCKPTCTPIPTPTPKPPIDRVCICLIWMAISVIAFILGILLCVCIHKLCCKRHGRY